MHKYKGKSDKEPLPNKTYCCGHTADCAIHKPPFDGRSSDCTCSEKMPWVRHQRRIPDPRLHKDHKTLQ